MTSKLQLSPTQIKREADVDELYGLESETADEDEDEDKATYGNDSHSDGKAAATCEVAHYTSVSAPSQQTISP